MCQARQNKAKTGESPHSFVVTEQNSSLLKNKNSEGLTNQHKKSIKK